MKIAVRYQSRGGNTKAVAEAVAKEAGIRAEPLDVPLGGAVDLLFVGGGVYGQNIDPSLKSYLEALEPNEVKSVAAFSTGGWSDGARRITAMAKAKGIAVRDETLPIKFGFRNFAWLGGKGHAALSAGQQRLVEDFVRKAGARE
ncbi:MAG: flavodoxin [Clostridiales Family XIII bacterium]|jgi:flavodoxin|nr:flavodoxin [Clostridiales Family XIII bacterium]